MASLRDIGGSALSQSCALTAQPTQTGAHTVWLTCGHHLFCLKQEYELSYGQFLKSGDFLL